MEYESDCAAPRDEVADNDHYLLEKEVGRLQGELEGCRERNETLKREIDELERDVTSKAELISEMEADIDARVSEQTLREKESLRDAEIQQRKHHEECLKDFKKEKSQELEQLRKREEELHEREVEARRMYGKYKEAWDRFSLLKKAYAEKFGKATVEEFERAVSTKNICHNCAGDGSATGHCRYCDGTGWEEKTVYEIEQSVRFDDDSAK